MPSNSRKTNSILAGVIAGTAYDTNLGARYLEKLGWQVTQFAISDSPEKQSALQHHNVPLLQEICLQKMLDMEKSGVELILIYCSSLSSVLNLSALRSAIRVPICTPLDYYVEIANTFSNFAVMAANARGLTGFECSISKVNPQARIVGFHDINIVRQIEQGKSVNKIIKENGIEYFLSIIESNHCQCLVLACTHYSYLLNEILAKSKLPVLDLETGLKHFVDVNNSVQKNQVRNK